MRKNIRDAFWTTACLLTLTTLALGQSKTIRKYSVVVAVEKQTATYYEKASAKPIATIVRAQMDTVNTQFNASGKFKDTYEFRVDSVYVVEGNFQNDLFKPQPGFDYKVAIDGYAAGTSVAGWYQPNRLIYHKWMWNNLGGPFAQNATKSLTQVFMTTVPATIQLTGANKTLYCAGDSLLAYATTDGSFDQTNAFSLQLSDSSGSFQKPTILRTGAPGEVLATLKSAVPTLPTGNYKIRVAGSQPVVYSNELPIRIQAPPAIPGISPLLTCQNATAPILTASGQNLRWYKVATGGTGSTTPPPVSTTQAGEATFYVSQSVAGCESPRAALKVTVQALPTLSVSGNTSIFIGEEAPIQLKFTGKPPYQYRLTNNLSGTATKDTTLLVAPKSTLSYAVQEVSNACGKGLTGNSASATVTVQNPVLETLAFAPTYFCPGGTVKVNYKKIGRFVTGTNFKIQIAKVAADGTPPSYTDLAPVSGDTSSTTSRLPVDLPSGSYRVRVVATHPLFVINGSTSPTQLVIGSAPTALLTGGEQIFGRDTAQLSIAFTGQGPWTFGYRAVFDNSVGTEFTITTADNPYLLRVAPLISTVYQLTSVRNACGSGTYSPESILIKVVPLLSTADPLTESRVAVFPVPTHATLTLRIGEFASQKAVRWELHNLLGQVVMQQKVRDEESVLSLEKLPVGLYLLRIHIGDQVVVRRVVKQ
ncbi:MAG: T9SS type A sorting domain-containing protein [Bacteroidetes bacterium]|nr:T9SS type A sorting domain-containing protein [Bacteroidota bacterium]